MESVQENTNSDASIRLSNAQGSIENDIVLHISTATTSRATTKLRNEVTNQFTTVIRNKSRAKAVSAKSKGGNQTGSRIKSAKSQKTTKTVQIYIGGVATSVTVKDIADELLWVRSW